MSNRLKIFSFAYTYAGGRYTVEIPACSLQEAKGRIAAIESGGAEFAGEIKATIPVPGGSWLARLLGR